MLTENHKRGDGIALTKGLLIAVSRLSGDGLALSVIACAMPPLLSRRGLGIPQSFPFSPEAPLGRGNNDDCSGADRCQRQMKGGEARAAFCFFKVPAKGLKKKQQTQPERQLRMLGAATRPCRAKRD